MPKQMQKNRLMDRLGDGARRAFEEHKAEEPELDTNAGLPAGIEGGVAKLVDCKFTQVKEGKQNAGKDMFYAAGICVSPETYGGVVTRGLRTQISEPLYDTPSRSRKTVEDHVKWVMDQMKILGVDMSEMSEDDLEDVAATLKEAQPHFRFRTWAGDKVEIVQRGGKWFAGTKGPYPTEAACKAANTFAGREPMVNNVWLGSCEYESDADDAGVVDNTAEESPKPSKAPKRPAKADPEPPEDDVATDDEADLDGLATAADGGDEASAAQLSELALQAGLTEDDIGGAESWAMVVSLMQGDEGPDEEAAESEDQGEIPKKGDVYAYKAPGKKKATDCEVTAVFEGVEKVNLKDLSTDKTYKGVPWAKLPQD